MLEPVILNYFGDSHWHSGNGFWWFNWSLVRGSVYLGNTHQKLPRESPPLISKYFEYFKILWYQRCRWQEANAISKNHLDPARCFNSSSHFTKLTISFGQTYCIIVFVYQDKHVGLYMIMIANDKLIYAYLYYILRCW